MKRILLILALLASWPAWGANVCITNTDGICKGLNIDGSGNLGTDVGSGSVASDAADSGNPVKVGGVYNATPPSLDDGDRGDVQLNSSGSVIVDLGSDNDVTVTATESTGTATDVDVDNAVGNIVVTIDTGAIAATRCSITFLNEDEAANATIDEWFFFLNPNGVTSLTNVTAYTEDDLAAPSGLFVMARTGTQSGEADATPDTTLDETDVLTVVFDVGGIDNLVVEAGASADDADVTYFYTCN